MWIDLPEQTLWQKLEDNRYLVGDPYPEIFLTGDGHRSPPFQWVERCESLRDHLRERMREHRLCLHVEQLQETVAGNSVPLLFSQVYSEGRVFGWELPIYRALQPVMERCYHLASDSAPISKRAAHDLGNEMLRIHMSHRFQIRDTGELFGPKMLATMDEFHAFYMRSIEEQGKPERDQAYRDFLLRYANAAMAMRITANPEIAERLRNIIDLNHGCTHLIACGFTHLDEHPLQRFLLLPAGQTGVIDRYSGR